MDAEHALPKASLPVVVVSGLPRSGTSLMMQMLVAGGLEALADDARPADQNNPLGYFEDARVKALRQDNHWLEHAGGKAVKVIGPLLPYLKPTLHYRVVFMQRDLEEVLDSQLAMLSRLGLEGAENGAALRQGFEHLLEELNAWLAAMPNVEVLYVPHREVMRNPANVAAQVNAFLGGGLEEFQMLQSVVPELWRARRPEASVTSGIIPLHER